MRNYLLEVLSLLFRLTTYDSCVLEFNTPKDNTVESQKVGWDTARHGQSSLKDCGKEGKVLVDIWWGLEGFGSPEQEAP